MHIYVCNKSGLVLAGTCRRNGLRGLQDRLVDLSLGRQLRLDGAVISPEVDTWWRQEMCHPQRSFVTCDFLLFHKKVVF